MYKEFLNIKVDRTNHIVLSALVNVKFSSITRTGFAKIPGMLVFCLCNSGFSSVLLDFDYCECLEALNMALSIDDVMDCQSLAYYKACPCPFQPHPSPDLAAIFQEASKMTGFHLNSE